MNNEPQTFRPKWSSTTKLVIVLLALLSVGYVFYKFGAAIYPMIIALILAYVLSPFVNFLERKLRWPRVLAIIVMFLFVFLVIGLVLWIIIPILTSQVRLFVQDIDIWIDQVQGFVAGQYIIAGFPISGQELISPLTNSLEKLLEPLVGSTIGLVATLLESLIWVIFIIIVSIYLIKESRSILSWFENLVPPYGRADYKHILQEINLIWGSFFRSQLLLSLIVSIIITVEGLIIGLPFALLMGIFAGLLEFFPSIGHAIWLVLASILGLLLGSTWLPLPNWAFLILILVIHIIFTQFDLNYLIPRIIGRSVHLPPLVVIIGIIGGASIAGVLGVVLAAPSIASLRVLGGYLYARIFDLEPFANRKTIVFPLPKPEIRFWQKPEMKREEDHT
jgi:predicted PurR-regulated permease PerM